MDLQSHGDYLRFDPDERTFYVETESYASLGSHTVSVKISMERWSITVDPVILTFNIQIVTCIVKRFKPSFFPAEIYNYDITAEHLESGKPPPPLIISTPTFKPKPDCGFGTNIKFYGITNAVEGIMQWNQASNKLTVGILNLKDADKFRGTFTVYSRAEVATKQKY